MGMQSIVKRLKDHPWTFPLNNGQGEQFMDFFIGKISHDWEVLHGFTLLFGRFLVLTLGCGRKGHTINLILGLQTFYFLPITIKSISRHAWWISQLVCAHNIVAQAHGYAFGCHPFRKTLP